jgi:hypothetical protein
MPSSLSIRVKSGVWKETVNRCSNCKTAVC